MVAQVSRVRPDARLAGFTVQAMINRPDAHELILGMAEDGTFGPIILFGQGGIATQVINDRSVSLPPLNMALAEDLAARTRVFKLLQGYRNQPAADLPGLYRVMVKLSQLIVDIPEIVELDINPLLLDQSGAMALDARIRVASSLLRGSDRLAIRPYPKELEEILEQEGVEEGSLLLRPILPSDVRPYQFFLRTLDADDAHNRFFCAVHQLAPSELARVTQIDYSREMTLVAVGQAAVSQDESKSETILGEVRLIFDPDNQQVEMGIAVSSALKSKGLGSKLLSKAIRYCRERGTTRMVGTVLAENSRMLRLARKFGFELSAPNDGVIDICLDLDVDHRIARPVDVQ
jgi:acetyltransferase